MSEIDKLKKQLAITMLRPQTAGFIVDKQVLADLIAYVEAAEDWRNRPQVVDEAEEIGQALWDKWTKAQRKLGLE